MWDSWWERDSVTIIRIKARFFDISLICAHVPIKEKDDVTKDVFYERMERSYESCPRHDIKIVLGDFNAMVGKKGIFGTTVGSTMKHTQIG